MTANLRSAIVVALALIGVVLLHRLAWLAVGLVVRSSRHFPPALAALGARVRDYPPAGRFAVRHPRLYGVLRARLSPRTFSGLPLTLMVVAALYLLALLGGLVEDLLMKEGIVALDAAINAFFAPWRTKPLLLGFVWLTGLGASPAIAAVATIATGFLWAARRLHMVVALWIALVGAEATTWTGKYLVGRARPEFLDVASAASPSFPSGHSTSAMAVYGFLAYAIARVLPGLRERFEVAFWTAIAILLIGFSRIFLSVHYTSDVASGFLVGGFWLLVGFAVAERSISKKGYPK